MANQPRLTESEPGLTGGAPRCLIDWELFEQLCGIQCTQYEIAHMLKIHPETLRTRVCERYNDTYTNVYERYSSPGRCSLRRYQYVMSKTNPTMAIWLGKNWLGQRDNPEDVITNVDLLNKMELVLNEIKQAQQAQIAFSSAREEIEDRSGSNRLSLHEAVKNLNF